MAREKKQVEEEPQAGAPEWMVTFSDCMTLLLTFFVLLLSFSSFSDKEDASYKKMTDSFAHELSFSERKSSDDSVLVVQRASDAKQQQEGSEQPTPEDGKKSQSKKKTEPSNFRDQKVFILSSDQIFWAKSTRISPSGKKQLAAMADYFKKMRNRIVITESGSKPSTNAGDLGLRRAWEIVDYLTSQGMDRELFSISAAGTVAKGVLSAASAQAERHLEIVLLERRIYN